MRRFGRYAIWVILYAAFVGAAVWLRTAMQASGESEIWGWDYQTFVAQIQDWRWIGYFGFRHPGLGVVFAPLVALEQVWSGAYLLVMPGVALLTAWIVWRMRGWLGLVMWLSFPTTWLMAGTPESFPVAQLGLVASVWWMISHKEHKDRWWVVGLMAVVNGMITITNGVKPLVAWLVGLRGKKLWMALGGIAAVVVGGAAFFYVRSMVVGRGVGAGIAMTLSWIPAERNLPWEWYQFFIRPVGLWQSFVVYPLVAWGVWRRGRAHTNGGRWNDRPTVVTLGAFFAVDAVIHLVIGWGMSEPWVFAPHWIWMLPILCFPNFKSAGTSHIAISDEKEVE